MATTQVWVVAFDVSDDRRRTKMARLLEAHGERVQKSVFELVLTARELEGVLGQARAAARFDADVDKLRVYSLCPACRGQARVEGQGGPVAAPGTPVVL